MKKEYIKPTMQVVELTNNSVILCASAEVFGTSYRKGKSDTEDLEEGDYWTDL